MWSVCGEGTRPGRGASWVAGRGAMTQPDEDRGRDSEGAEASGKEGGRPRPHPSGPGGQGQDGDFPAPVCSSALPRSAHSPRPRAPQGKRTR